MKWIIACVLALGVLPSIPTRAADAPILRLADGDRVVFVGSTLVERDAEYGYFETLLHVRNPVARFSFRNLGWSGDTVWGEARAEFGTQKDGYDKLIAEVTGAKPTVLLIAYGMNESFAGEAGLPKFLAQYEQLLSDFSKLGAKTWLIGPNRHEDLPRPLPDPAEHNKQLKLYSDAIRDLAARRQLGFVDLFDALPDGRKENPPRPLTDDGIHYTRYGAWRFGNAMADAVLPIKSTPTTAGGDDAKPLEALRQKTVAKNREHFYRWRPQNDTYIFGFRKHEQGQNAVEIPKFDPIVDKLEAEINDMAKATKPDQILAAPAGD
jgi:lysophospholipase L1-like esterase